MKLRPAPASIGEGAKRARSSSPTDCHLAARLRGAPLPLSSTLRSYHPPPPRAMDESAGPAKRVELEKRESTFGSSSGRTRSYQEEAAVTPDLRSALESIGMRTRFSESRTCVKGKRMTAHTPRLVPAIPQTLVGGTDRRHHRN